MRTRRSKKFTIYLPSRQEHAIKGTLDILKGIALFLQQKNHIDPDNVLVKMPLFGMDSIMIPRTLKDLGLEGHTEIVPLFPKPEFAKALSKCDVVIDQLRLGAYGGVAIQAMSCAKTVIVNAWKPWYQEQLDDTPPILYAKTDYDVCAQLLHAYDFYERKYFRMAESAREYAVKHHDYRKVSRKVLDCMEG
jgi:glycosyltransferase involved in cell wall biosynthesis